MAAISALTSTANPSLAIGPNGATNPTLQTDSSVASAATGIKVIGRAAAAGADLVVTSSGTNENLKIDAKGSGTVTINGTATGAISLARNTDVTGTMTVSSTLAVTGASTLTGAATLSSTLGVAGNVAVNTDKFTVAAASGNTVVAGTLAVAGASTLTGAATLSSTLAVTGAATLSSTLGVTGNVAVNTDKFTVTAASGNTAAAGSLKSTSATGGVGYATGAGGAVTQITSRTTGVTLNTATGAITLVSAAGSTTPASFTVTNSAVAATDVIILNQKSGTDKLSLSVTAVGAGSFEITFNTKSGTTTETPVINFAVIKGVAA